LSRNARAQVHNLRFGLFDPCSVLIDPQVFTERERFLPIVFPQVQKIFKDTPKWVNAIFSLASRQ
jgi:hypothetical protein